MKFFFSIFFVMLLLGCKTYKSIKPNEIKAIYVLFNGRADHQKYRLYNDSVVKFDTRHSQVKIALDRYKERLETLHKQPANYLDSLIVNTEIIKAAPIKVLPLREFGYIQTYTNELIFYGISKTVFIDLTRNRVYFKKTR